MSLSPGQTLNNRYRIDGLLGRGGMGSVYDAWDLNLGIRCAIKENQLVTDDAMRQFEREARMLATLRHSNLPTVTDHFIIPGQGQYLVMSFIEGEDLKQRLERLGPLAEADVRRWAFDILNALAYLHQRNIVHRDIKPANIKITPQDNAVLVDFGIAKEIDAGGGATTTGARGLTPGFAPPEQYGVGAGRTDARSDIYALGATLYTLLTGKPPTDALARLMNPDSYTPLSQRGLNLRPSLVEAIDKALTIAPAERFADAEEMLGQRRSRPTGQTTMSVTMPVATEANQPASTKIAGKTAATKPPFGRTQSAEEISPPRRRWLMWAAIGALALLAMMTALVAALALGGRSASPTLATVTEAPAVTATVQPSATVAPTSNAVIVIPATQTALAVQVDQFAAQSNAITQTALAQQTADRSFLLTQTALALQAAQSNGVTQTAIAQQVATQSAGATRTATARAALAQAFAVTQTALAQASAATQTASAQQAAAQANAAAQTALAQQAQSNVATQTALAQQSAAQSVASTSAAQTAVAAQTQMAAQTAAAQQTAQALTATAQTNPAPVINSLNPNPVAKGSSGFTLTVNGQNFVGGSVVQWNGSARATTFVNNAQLTASIADSDLAQTGVVNVTVFNPSPGGGASNAASFYVVNPVPSLTSLSPASVVVGGPGFTLTVNGANFVNGAVVKWNGSVRTTTFVNDTQLMAVISASDISAVGAANVTAFNLAPGGGLSNALTLTVTALGITLSPPDLKIPPGATRQLTVTISALQSANRVISLSSSTANVYIPSSVTIPAGSTSASIPVFAVAPGSAVITSALANGLGGASASVGVEVCIAGTC